MWRRISPAAGVLPPGARVAAYLQRLTGAFRVVSSAVCELQAASAETRKAALFIPLSDQEEEAERRGGCGCGGVAGDAVEACPQRCLREPVISHL